MNAFSAGVPLEVPPLEVINSPRNPRKKKGLDVASLSELASSIRAQGIMQPIIVRPLPGYRVPDTADMDPKPVYEIIAGERRWRAAQIAELITMPVLMRDNLSEEQVDEIRLVENIQREDLDPLEEAEGFEQLRVKHGYSIKQIAAKITDDKGESYVYKRLALNRLIETVRDAMYEEDPLDLSLAQLVATYEPAQQDDVLDYLRRMKAAAENRWPTFRTAQTALAKAFHLVLSAAPFDTASADLLPEAGSCNTCPKNTATRGDLFGDSEGPASCTDTGCFQKKREAHAMQLRAEFAKKGVKVIEGDDAIRATQGIVKGAIKGYQRLDAVAYTDLGNDGKEREVTFGDALRGMGKKAPKARMFIDPHSLEAVPVITTDLAEQLIPADRKPAGKKAKAAAPSSSGKDRAPAPVDDRPPEQRALANRDVERAVLLRIFDSIRTGERSLYEMRLVARALFSAANRDDCLMTGHTEAYLGWGPELDDKDNDEAIAIIEAKLDALPVSDIAQVMAMAAVEIVINSFETTPAQHAAIAQAYHVDILAVRDKVAEDLARQAGDDDGDDDGAEPEPFANPGFLPPDLAVEPAKKPAKKAAKKAGKK